MTSIVDVSVVIGFKDWGVNRLRLAVQTVQDSFGDLSGEVIVSDYGSSDYAETRQVLEELGAIYVYTPTDGVWSRSRALNAGFSVSSGRVLISTDADMIFSPKSMQTIGERILEDPNLALVLQCRDLPEGYSDQELAESGVDWEVLQSAARIRPRWGMGGMMATSRKMFLEVRGLDERMEIYGGEDIDFANRLRRAGARIEWMNDEDVRMYHMWHPHSRKIASETAEGRDAIELNRKIQLEDKTYVRNTKNWKHAPSDALLPVSVVVSTFNRGRYIADCVESVLAQTFSDFELIIVDDGSTDGTRDVVESFDDERVRYFYRENAGIAAARNFAASVSRGRYTAVHDDDDIMLPWRLQKHMDTILPGVHGSYGAWIDFHNRTGEMNLLPGKDLSLGSILTTGKVYLHPTMMVATDVIKRLGYNESLRSGSDFNLGVRMMRSGITMRHTGFVHTLRRLHDGQITETDSDVQQTSAILTHTLARVSMSTADYNDMRKTHSKTPKYPFGNSAKIIKQAANHLPAHLIRRSAVVYEESEVNALSAELMPVADRFILVHDAAGQLVSQLSVYDEIPYATVKELQRCGYYVEHREVAGFGPSGGEMLMAVDAIAEAMRKGNPDSAAPVLVFVADKNLDALVEYLNFELPAVRLTKRMLSDEDSLLFVVILEGSSTEDMERVAIQAGTKDISLRYWFDTRESIFDSPQEADQIELLEAAK